MNNLNGKIIYVVATGCRRSKELPEFIHKLEQMGATVYLFATEACKQIVDFKDGNFKDIKLRFNNNKVRRMEIPKEDLVIVAPCSFNTLNKIANGIADSYPLTIIQTAIGKGTQVVLCTSMNYDLWNNFSNQSSLTKLSKVENVNIIWPEFFYNDYGEVVKLSMAPWAKVEDTVLSFFHILPFNPLCLNLSNDYNEDDNDINAEVKIFGRVCKELYLCLNKAGCIAKKVDEGVLISATGASVGDLRNEDIVLVKNLNKNDVLYEGKKPPSSESIIAYEILKNKPIGTCLIHCHCQRITYSTKSKIFTTKEYFNSNNPTQVEEVKEIIKKFGYVNLHLHGQIFCGNSFEEIIGTILKNYYKIS